MQKSRARRVLIGASALLALHAALVLVAIRKNYATFDEPAYLLAGLSHWQTKTFTLYRVNPPLPRMVAALPVLAMEPKTDWSTLELWQRFAYGRPEFGMLDQFTEANRAHFFDMLCVARLSTLLWSLLGALVVFRWARERFGDIAGLVALGCWCFEPNILAHAALLTPDIPATSAGILALYAAWRYHRAPSGRRALAVGLTFGLALVTKFTWIVLAPIEAILFAHAALRHARESGGRAIVWAMLRQMLGATVVALTLVHACYGFQGVLPRLGSIPFVSPTFSGLRLENPGPNRDFSANRFADTPFAGLRLPVPEEVVRGIDVQRRDFDAHPESYLNGEWKQGGWWHYYLYALALKVPFGIWVLVAVASVVAWRRRESADVGLLVPPFAVLAFVSSQTGFSHHLRYVLPLFPFLFIHASRAVTLLAAKTPWKLMLPAAALHAVISSLAIAPRSLAYFNELAGGPQGGPKHLLNSNIDWGQDLLELKDWLAAHPEARPLHLAYFNHIRPETEGIEYLPVPRGPNVCASPTNAALADVGPQPGFYALSVNYVYGATLPVSEFGEHDRRRLMPDDYAYFRQLEPIARAGHSIYIYEITTERANQLRRRMNLRPIFPWAQLARRGPE